MSARLNHVSICVSDVDEAAAFYSDLFDAKEIPHHNAGVPLRWLAFGETQLHVFHRPDIRPAPYYHFALAVDDFETVYAKAIARGVENREAFGHHLYEIPSGQIQLYVTDPSGNLLEINAPGADRIGDEARSALRRWVDTFPQDESNLEARLFV